MLLLGLVRMVQWAGILTMVQGCCTYMTSAAMHTAAATVSSSILQWCMCGSPRAEQLLLCWGQCRPLQVCRP
jgi:hypothetical protein